LSFSNAFVVEASLPKDPDRSHLADAIHFMDLIDLADDELPAARATVEQSSSPGLVQTETEETMLTSCKNEPVRAAAPVLVRILQAQVIQFHEAKVTGLMDPGLSRRSSSLRT
jgi:hypothetical protein